MSEDTLSPAARRTLPGRTAFQAKFASEEERSAFYREIGRKGVARRVILTPEEKSAIGKAHRMLDSLSGAYRLLAAPPEELDALHETRRTLGELVTRIEVAEELAK